MRDILVLCPQERDREAVAAAGLHDRYRVRFVGEDLDRMASFDPAALLAEWEGLPADAVVATKDQSALLAAILAERRGLPGPAATALLACQHKPTSRRIQRAVAPRSTPRFALLDGGLPFAAPVLRQARRRAPLGAGGADRRPERPRRPRGARRLLPRATRRSQPSRGHRPTRAYGYLAEELLTGLEVTLEGYVHRGRVTTIGVTDSVTYEGTISFERFEYPTRLGRGPPRRARRARRSPGARRTGSTTRASTSSSSSRRRGPPEIIELNGRLASQFAPLVQRVHGRSTYDALFQVACGDDPGWSPSAPDGVGVSYVVRVFEDAYVESAPEPEPDLEVLVRPGARLSEQGTNDAQSYRIAILYGFGETREEAVERCRERARSLSFRLA